MTCLLCDTEPGPDGLFCAAHHASLYPDWEIMFYKVKKGEPKPLDGGDYLAFRIKDNKLIPIGKHPKPRRGLFYGPGI